MCFFCNLYDETPLHIFYECDIVKWADLVQCFQNDLILPTVTPQAAILGILESESNDSIFKNNEVLINHILLILKLISVICVISPEKKSSYINLNNLIAEI